jgi:hypothetical protein
MLRCERCEEDATELYDDGLCDVCMESDWDSYMSGSVF